MGSDGGVWDVGDVISASRMNRKTQQTDTGANINSATTYPGKAAFCTSTGSGFTAGYLYRRNNGDTAWYVDSVVGLQDIWIPSTAMWARSTNGPGGLTRTETSTNKVNYQTFDFDTTTQEHAQFGWQPPRNWNNSTVKFTPYWTYASSSGGVVWALQGYAFSNDDALDTAFGTEQTSTDTAITAADVHVGPQSSAITINGTPADSDYIHFQVKRNPSDSSDTLGSDALLLGITLEITLDAGVAG